MRLHRGRKAPYANLVYIYIYVQVGLVYAVVMFAVNCTVSCVLLSCYVAMVFFVDSLWCHESFWR